MRLSLTAAAETGMLIGLYAFWQHMAKKRIIMEKPSVANNVARDGHLESRLSLGTHG